MQPCPQHGDGKTCVELHAEHHAGPRSVDGGISLSDIAPALIDCVRCLGGHFLDSLDCFCAYLFAAGSSVCPIS
jgi:hypothetical protein